MGRTTRGHEWYESKPQMEYYLDSSGKWRYRYYTIPVSTDLLSVLRKAKKFQEDGKDYEFEHADETSVFEMIKKSIDSEKGRHKDGTEF